MAAAPHRAKQARRDHITPAVNNLQATLNRSTSLSQTRPKTPTPRSHVASRISGLVVADREDLPGTWQEAQSAAECELTGVRLGFPPPRARCGTATWPIVQFQIITRTTPSACFSGKTPPKQRPFSLPKTRSLFLKCRQAPLVLRRCSARKPFQPLSNGTSPLHAGPTPQVPSPQSHGGAVLGRAPSSSSCCKHPPIPLYLAVTLSTSSRPGAAKNLALSW